MPVVSRTQFLESDHKLGVLGGMGPRASAAFVQTLYRMNGPEQNRRAPTCILLSDPYFPDRSEAILSGREEVVVRSLTQALEVLRGAGAVRVIMACMTIHHFLARVPDAVGAMVVSLVDLTMGSLSELGGRFLLLASGGTRAGRLFESHPGWKVISERVVFPNPLDQDRLRYWLERLKTHNAEKDCVTWLLDLSTRYGVDGLIFGCTELHLLQEILLREPEIWRPGLSIVDPLVIAAEKLGAFFE